MKVLVTGDTGYIGSIMMALLEAEGFEATGVDTDYFADCVFDTPRDCKRHISKNIWDLTARDLEGFDAIFHLAAISNDPMGALNAGLTYQNNHDAALRLATIAKQAGVARFIFSSSCSLYGSSSDAAVTEEAAFNPLTAYARSKVMLEWTLASLADATFSPVYMRNATAYGVSPRMRFDLVLNNLVAWAVAEKTVLIKSDGTPWRPIVHIEDICRAFIAAARAPRDVVHNEAFNIGADSENYQVRDIADIVSQVVPDCEISYAPGGEPDKRSYRVDFTKVRTQLPGFVPKWTARAGAEELYQAYKRVGVDKDVFEGPRFRRINTLQRLISEGKLNTNLSWSSGSDLRRAG